MMGIGVLDSIASADEIHKADSSETAQRAAKKRVENETLPKPEHMEPGKVTRPAKNTGENWFKNKMLPGFQAIKLELEAIHSDGYYRVLGLNGYDSSNQIPDRDTATRIYREMKEVLNDEKLALQDKNAFDQHMERSHD
jgi:hypothetical protein